jgi:Tfp pilus assembly protein PilO
MAFDASLIIYAVKKHPLGFAALGVAIALAIGNTVRSGSKDELLVQIEEFSSQSSRLKNNLKYSAGLNEQLASVSGAAMEIVNRAINPASLATNLQYFYRLESDLGLEFSDLRQGVSPSTKAGASFTSVPYSLAVEGSYSQLIDFLRRLENGSLLVRIVSTNFSPSRSDATGGLDPSEPMLSLNLNLEALGKQ